MTKRVGRLGMGLKMKSNPPSLFQSRIVVLSICHIYNTAVYVLAYMRIFFVYVPVCLCVCGGLLLYRRVTRDSATLEGGEGLNRAGQNIINHGRLADTHVT
jgi:hypothetical protein